MKEKATVATIAIIIAIVKAVVNRGEKVLSAYMIVTPFVFIVVGGLVIDGSARLFSLCSSVVNRNEWGITSSRYAGTIGAKNNAGKFFFKFFFRGVWVRGCGGARVRGWRCGAAGWRRGGLDGGGMEMGRAGWRRDADGAGWMEADWMERGIGLPGCPNPGFGLPARV